MLYICNFSDPEHPDHQQDQQLLVQLRAQLKPTDSLVLLNIGSLHNEELKTVRALTTNVPMLYKVEGVASVDSDDFPFITAADFVELCISSQGIISLY